MTANCYQNLHAYELHYVSGSTWALSGRLTQHDKNSVKSNCFAFSRLVESFYDEPERLLEIVSSELLANLKQLLVVFPPVLLSTTFIMVVRMLSIMFAHCSQFAVKLLKQDIVHTLCLLLMGSSAGSATSSTSVSAVVETPSPMKEYGNQVELVSCNPQVRIIIVLKVEIVDLNYIFLFRNCTRLCHSLVSSCRVYPQTASSS